LAKFVLGKIIISQELDEQGNPVIKKLRSISTDVIDADANVINEKEFREVIERARKIIKDDVEIDGVIFKIM
jgi:hypothetical protein